MEWHEFITAVCCGLRHMSSLGVAVSAISCPNGSKLALYEGQQMVTIARGDFSCLNACYYDDQESIQSGAKGVKKVLLNDFSDFNRLLGCIAAALLPK